MSNFTSPPCHAISFFFFPVYPSAIRGVDELALRVLPPYLLYHPHSSLRSPLSIPTTHSLPLFLSSFLRPSHPFHDRCSVSLTVLRPPFSCLSVVSSLLPRPSAHLLPPLSQSFPSFAARVGSIYSFPLPPTPKTLFSCGPFASTVIRHPSFSFYVPLFFRLTPTIGRDNLPFSLVLSYISILASIPPAVSFSFPLTFSFLLYIHLSIFPFRSLPNQPSCLFPLRLLLISPRSAGSFSVERLLRFSNVIDASPPRFFPDFSLSRPPFSRRRPTGFFSGKTQAETTAPLFLHLAAISRFQAAGGIGIFQETFLRCPLSQSSSLLSLAFLPSFVEMRMIKGTNKICMTTSGFCIKYYILSRRGPSDLAVMITRNFSAMYKCQFDLAAGPG